MFAHLGLGMSFLLFPRLTFGEKSWLVPWLLEAISGSSGITHDGAGGKEIDPLYYYTP